MSQCSTQTTGRTVSQQRDCPNYSGNWPSSIGPRNCPARISGQGSVTRPSHEPDTYVFRCCHMPHDKHNNVRPKDTVKYPVVWNLVQESEKRRPWRRRIVSRIVAANRHLCGGAKESALHQFAYERPFLGPRETVEGTSSKRRIRRL